MRLDIEVIDAHRREAGAPEPTPMEDMEFPPLPGNSQARRPRRENKVRKRLQKALMIHIGHIYNIYI